MCLTYSEQCSLSVPSPYAEMQTNEFEWDAINLLILYYLMRILINDILK